MARLSESPHLRILLGNGHSPSMYRFRDAPLRWFVSRLYTTSETGMKAPPKTALPLLVLSCNYIRGFTTKSEFTTNKICV